MRKDRRNLKKDLKVVPNIALLLVQQPLIFSNLYFRVILRFSFVFIILFVPSLIILIVLNSHNSSKPILRFVPVLSTADPPRVLEDTAVRFDDFESCRIQKMTSLETRYEQTSGRFFPKEIFSFNGSWSLERYSILEELSFLL